MNFIKFYEELEIVKDVLLNCDYGEDRMYIENDIVIIDEILENLDTSAIFIDIYEYLYVKLNFVCTPLLSELLDAFIEGEI